MTKTLVSLMLTLALLLLPTTASPRSVWYERLGTEQADVMRGGPPPGGGMNGLAGDDVLVNKTLSKDFMFGGEGNDTLSAGPNAEGFRDTDDLFGGGFCRETSYYGFEQTAAEEGWPDYSTLPCNIDGADILRGGAGRDWLWESNSDITGDGQVDILNGGSGSRDICIAEEIDIVRNCEEVRIIPTATMAMLPHGT